MTKRFATLKWALFKLKKSRPGTLSQTSKSQIRKPLNKPLTASPTSKLPKWPNKRQTNQANRNCQSYKINQNLSVQPQKPSRTDQQKKMRNHSGISKARHRFIGKITQ
jgi:hypothetical protein